METDKIVDFAKEIFELNDEVSSNHSAEVVEEVEELPTQDTKGVDLEILMQRRMSRTMNNFLSMGGLSQSLENTIQELTIDTNPTVEPEVRIQQPQDFEKIVEEVVQ